LRKKGQKKELKINKNPPNCHFVRHIFKKNIQLKILCLKKIAKKQKKKFF